MTTSRLRFDLNLGTINNLPDWSCAPRGTESEIYTGIREAGFEGVQTYFPIPAAGENGLRLSGMGKVMTPGDAMSVAAQHKALGFDMTTLHVGHGLESNADMDVLADAVIDAAAQHRYPLLVETHRATMTQDIRRTLDLIERRPALRFNADLSHWYTGHEMISGDFAAKLDLLSPLFERVRYIHGRIGDSCAMQAPLGDPASPPAYVGHFVEMWTRCCSGFLKSAAEDERLVFAPELLPAEIVFGAHRMRLNYARLLPDGQEETDRWADALRLCDMARSALTAAEERRQA